MFFDIGWSEFMVIGVVALIVIGPKDLPAALRVAGYWVRKARTMSREFHSSVEQMMREVELHEVQAELKKVTDFNLDHEFRKIVDPVNDPTAGSQPRAIPDYVETTPAPVFTDADPAPPPAAVEAAAEEPGVPTPTPAPPPAAVEAAVEEPGVPMPIPAPHADPEPARAAEPTKP